MQADKLIKERGPGFACFLPIAAAIRTVHSTAKFDNFSPDSGITKLQILSIVRETSK